MKLQGIQFSNIRHRNKIELIFLLYDNDIEKYSVIKIMRQPQCGTAYSLNIDYKSISKTSAKDMQSLRSFIKCDRLAVLQMRSSGSLLSSGSSYFSKERFLTELDYFARIETNAFVLDAANGDIMISKDYISLPETMPFNIKNDWIVI